MSVMYTRKQPRRRGQSSEARQGRAYRRMAAKALLAGQAGKAEQMLSMSNYWTARANCNRDKDFAVDGAVITVSMSA